MVKCVAVFRYLSILVMVASVIGFDSARAGDGKLKGTAGVSSISGAAGGGLTPWAVVGSYATRDEVGVNAFNSEARVDDYGLSVHGVALGLYDRVEISFAHQDLFSDALDRSIRQNIAGIKLRLMGDLVYGDWPVVSLGVERKTLLDEEVLGLVGADDEKGTDYFLSAAKAWINGPFNRTGFANVNLRHSEANENGLLGFGGGENRSNWLAEIAAGLFLTNDWVVGMEFRQKRSHLSALGEDHWRDIFVAWFPNKHLSLTAAYLDLGEIVGQESQTGFYISMQGSF